MSYPEGWSHHPHIRNELHYFKNGMALCGCMSGYPSSTDNPDKDATKCLKCLEIKEGKVYPEHEKLSAVKDKSQAIGDFVEWLREKGFVVCKKWPIEQDEATIEWEKKKADRKGIKYEPPFEWLPANLPIEQTLADFYEIDLKKIDAENEQILEGIRALNHKEPMETKKNGQ